MSLTVWIIIVLLIGINALYVAAEFAAVGVRHSRIQQLAENGNRQARQLLPILQDGRALDRYIAACQIGITLSSLLLGAYGQATLTRALAPLFADLGAMQMVTAFSVAAVVVLLGLTTLQMVLGELMPKALALQYPTQIALYTVAPMRWSLVLLSWFITFLNGSGNLLLKALGAPQTGHRHIHSPEEIDLLIAESRDGGLLEPDEQRRLHQALQLSSRPAHQLMVPRLQMAAVAVDTPPEALLEQMLQSPYTRLPVYRGTVDHIVGMLHTKDLLVYYLEHGRIPSAEVVMRPMTILSETVTADRLISLMRKHHSRQAVLVDEFGGVAGLVTVEHILSEVLGVMPDEALAGQPRPERLPDGRVRLPGRMRLYEVAPWVGVHWEGEADTVGGLIMERLGYLPLPQERLEIDGVPLEVEQVTDRVVVSVLAVPVASPPEAAPHEAES